MSLLKGVIICRVQHSYVSQGMSFAYFPSVSDEEAISVIHR